MQWPTGPHWKALLSSLFRQANIYRNINLETTLRILKFCRTPRDLMIQWERLRQYSLLADQTVQPLNLGDSVLNFSDVEEQVSA